MLIKFKDNRVRRSYFESGIINDYSEKMPKGYPEDWIASVVEAFNPGFKRIENEGLSQFENGILFKNYIDEHPRSLGKNKNISILVKFLDAGERLVIQCHPTDEFAKKHFNSSFGKTECWYIIDSTPDAYVYLGFNESAEKTKWIEAFKKQDVEMMLSMLHKFNVKKGDCIFVEGGVPHAIGEGCFMLELQQPTDLMVIPERKTLSGRVLTDAKMHGGLGFEKMFDCFEYKIYKKEEILEKYFSKARNQINEISTLVSQKFVLEEVFVSGSFNYDSKNTYAVLVIVDGEGYISDGINNFKITKGDKFFIEANTKLKFTSENIISACICRP